MRLSRAKLTGDFGNAIEGIRIGNCLPILFSWEIGGSATFGLLQHNRHSAEIERSETVAKMRALCDYSASTLQDEVHDMVVFGFVLALQAPREMDKMNFDPLHNRILLQNAARDFISHRSQRGRF